MKDLERSPSDGPPDRSLWDSSSMPTESIPAQPLPDQRTKFEVDDAVAYFNAANLSPVLRSVRAAGEAALARRSKPWTISAPDWFAAGERLRVQRATLLGVHPHDVAHVPSTSYGLAAVARNLTARPGDRVLVLASEFPSNYYTWKRFASRTGAELLVVGRESGQEWTEAILAAIDDHVVVASVPNVHWTNGALVDLSRVGAALERVGAAFVIDASQSLGAMPLDVPSLRPTAVVSVGYKWLLGPMSYGSLYVAPSLRDGEPLEENWISRSGADDFTTLVDYQDDYMPGARRFDVGQYSNFHLVPMAIAAMEQIEEWGVPRIGATLAAVTGEIGQRAAKLGLGVTPADRRGPHIIGLDLPVPSARRAAAALEAANVIVSRRGSSIRIAPHLHNNRDDVDRLLTAIASVL